MSNDSLDDSTTGGENRKIYIEKIDLIQQTESLVQAKMEDLEDRWKKLNSSYESIMLSSDPSVTKEVRDKAKINFNVCSEAYYGSRSRHFDISKITSSSDPRVEAFRIGITPNDFPIPRGGLEPHSNDSPNVYIKVPPCDTEVFKGGYEEWPSFRDMFTAVYVNHPKLTPAQKLYHLRNKTQGSAGAIVKRYTLCDENFELAWRALKARFENKRVLVDNQLKILFNIPVAAVETSDSVQKIQSTVNDCLATLRTLDVKVEYWDPILIYLISTKLPDKTLSLWEQSLSSHSELPMWSQLDEFLIDRYEIVERLSSIRSTKDGYNQPSPPVNRTQAYHSQEKLDLSCPLCEENHSLRICSKFRGFTEQERIDFVFRNKFCNNCLSTFHRKQKCKSKNKCSVCQKSHHTLLHLKQRSQVESESNRVKDGPVTTEPRRYPNSMAEDTSNPSSSGLLRRAQVQANFASSNGTILLRTAMVQVDHGGQLFTLRALIDPGSQRTFLSEKARNLLQIPYRRALFDIFGIGEQKLSSNKECELVLYSSRYNLRIAINAIVLPKVTQKLPSVSFSITNPEELSELDLADPFFNKSSQIDLILGNDSEKYLNIDGIKKNICGDASAYNTIFGWVLSGPMRTEQIQAFTTNVLPSENTALNETLQKFWELEDIPASPPISEEDQFCEEFYVKTTVRGPDGRYIVRLPFKKEFSNSIHLGSSRFLALGQLTRMENTLSKNPELQFQYNSVLEEYLSMGHMEETSSEEVFSDGKFYSFYLPHHAVVRPEHKSTKETIDLQTQLITTLKSAGFPLKKMTANNSRLLNHLPPEDMYDLNFLRLDETSSTKTLGVMWNALTDSFSYALNPINTTTTLTKRKVLSAVSQLFDPAGWITPVIIRAKILMQQLWLEGLDWDSPISEESHLTWEGLMKDFSHIIDLRIPRWIRYMPSDRVQIHGFADASKAAYCACVYIVVDSGFESCSNLLIAKSRVAPLKTVCLPRLELIGAELLAKLVNYILSVFDFEIAHTFLWTDSSIVLGWLSKPPWSWETFVANRTSRIHSLVPNAQWRHVPTADNPADLGTRGCSPRDLTNSKLWWNGPSWMTATSSSWPEMVPITPPGPPEGLAQTFHIVSEDSEILKRFSSYDRALRVISYIYRFYHRTHPTTRSTANFSSLFEHN
ncbi:uncharacterized protein LOC131997032 [Stomoxys calcitrans]|uniref:uncharacterized protein LOC131997032 n=1 Tax=Stomoxys calcitrans TaxID=35570 RepID=UPI0027E2BAA2|nr:uncharacterized protein LOC131997032 [Stomoxys calcitrans]